MSPSFSFSQQNFSVFVLILMQIISTVNAIYCITDYCEDSRKGCRRIDRIGGCFHQTANHCYAFNCSSDKFYLLQFGCATSIGSRCDDFVRDFPPKRPPQTFGTDKYFCECFFGGPEVNMSNKKANIFVTFSPPVTTTTKNMKVTSTEAAEYPEIFVKIKTKDFENGSVNNKQYHYANLNILLISCCLFIFMMMK